MQCGERPSSRPTRVSEAVPGLLPLPRDTAAVARQQGHVEDGIGDLVLPGQREEMHESERSKGNSEVQKWRRMVDGSTRERARQAAA